MWGWGSSIPDLNQIVKKTHAIIVFTYDNWKWLANNVSILSNTKFISSFFFENS
jgi:hypothetical protein